MNSKDWGRFKCVACGDIWRHPNAGTGPLTVPSLCEECREEPEGPPGIRENPFALEHEI